MGLYDTIQGGVAGAGKTLYDQDQNKRLTTDARNYDRAEWDRTYDKTRKDAISDRDYNNKYNSPEQQMIRLKDAGLNPHLVYGNGAQTTASQINDAKPNARNSAPMRAVEQPNPYTSSVELANKQAATALTQAQTVHELVRGKDADFDLGLKTELRDTTIAGAKLANQNTQTGIIVQTDANDRANDLQSGAIKKQDKEIDKIVQDTKKSKEDTKFTKDSNTRASELQKENIKKIQQEVENLEGSNQHTRQLKAIALQDEKLKKFENLLRAIDVNPNESDWVQSLNQKLRKLSVSKFYYTELYNIYRGK